MAFVEQARLKRAGVGLRAHDPDRAYPGYTLFAPLLTATRGSTGGSAPVEASADARYPTYLIDMEGNVVHSWHLPYPPRCVFLTDHSTLFYNGQIRNPSYMGQQPFQGGVALEANWNSDILWEVRQPEQHHDGLRLRNGNVLLLCHTPIPADLVPKVRGGMPGTEHDGDMYGDYLLELTTNGRTVWEWRAWEHLDPHDDPITAFQDSRDMWTTGNGIAEWPNGDISVSFRNISTVVTISRETGDIIWKLGAPPLCGQHAPTPLPNGHLLIFDNGPHRLDDTYPYSRVIEVDPATNEIVWKYQDSPMHNFFSSRQSNARRLPNGNTLICEANFGRFFKVTSDCDVVWEYVNPYFSGPPKGQFNSVFRVYRYSAEEIEKARASRSVV